MLKKIFSGCLTIIVIIILLGIIIGACTGGDEDKKDATSSTKTETNKEEKTTASKDTTEKESVKKEKTEKTYKIGDVVNVGKMQYKIKSVKLANEVGTTYGKEKANDVFVVIGVDVKNNGDEAVTVDASFFKLLKDKKTFETDNVASMSANQSEDGNVENSFFLQEVNPESKISGFVVFDVSNETAKSKNLKLQVQTGAWGTETEVISLNR